MKVRDSVNPDVDNIGESDSFEAKMSATSMRFILKLLSNIYKDPKGSIVRELTSNCFDAHKDAGVDDKSVIVSYVDPYSAEGYISFRDFGKGMTPEFMKNTYFVYGESTKRDKEDQFGYFGLGSKSPLSIRDQYEIVSYVDGTRYHYLVYVGDNDMPTCDILDTSETDELNGTEVRVTLDGDNYNWTTAIKTQLKYFEDVFFVHSNIDHLNDYKIVNGEYFKYNTHDNFRRVSRYADIAFDRVSYPIDFQQLNQKALEIPIGIKFTRDELVPVPSREDVQYDDQTKTLLAERIKLALLELKDIYFAKYPPKCDDYITYTNKLYGTPIHQFIDIKYVTKYLSEVYGIEIPYLDYTPLKKYGITAKKKDCLSDILDCHYEVSSVLRAGNNLKSSKYTQYQSVYDSKKRTLIADPGEQLDKIKNKFISDGIVVRPRVRIAMNYKKWLIKNINSCFNLPKTTKGLYTLVVATVISDYLDKINRYEDLVVPQEFIDSIKDQRRELGDNIIYYTTTSDHWTFKKSSHKQEASISEIIEHYASAYHRARRRKNNTKTVRTWLQLVIAPTEDWFDASFINTVFHTELLDQKTKIIVTSKTNMNKMLKLDSDDLKITSLSRFVSKSIHMKRYATALRINETGGIPTIHSSVDMHTFNTQLGKDIEFLRSYCEIVKVDGYSNKFIETKTTFNSEISEMSDILGLIDKNIIRQRDKIDIQLGKIPLFAYLKGHTPKDLVFDYMRTQRFRIKADKSLYKIHKDWSKDEKAFMKELKAKRDYLQMIDRDRKVRKSKPQDYFTKQQSQIINHNLNSLNHDKTKQNFTENSYKSNTYEKDTGFVYQTSRSEFNGSVSIQTS